MSMLRAADDIGIIVDTWNRDQPTRAKVRNSITESITSIGTYSKKTYSIYIRYDQCRNV